MPTKPLPELTASDIKRFWYYVDVKGPDECWPWTGYKIWTGYGKITIGGLKALSTRIAFKIHTGEDPHPFLVAHTCDNPICQNPSHLFKATSKQNTQDAKQKGRLTHGDQQWQRLHPEKRMFGERNGSAKLTEVQVIAIRKRYQELPTITQQELATIYGVDQTVISNAITGRKWSHLPVSNYKSKKFKLTEEQVLAIRKEHRESPHIAQSDLSVKYNVDASTVSNIISRRTWKHLPDV